MPAKNPITLRSSRKPRTKEEIAEHDRAVRQRESERIARVNAWLEVRAKEIHDAEDIGEARELLRQACQAYEHFE